MNGRVAAAALLIMLLGAGNSPGTQRRGERDDEPRVEQRGWLGVGIQDVTPRIAREKDLHVKSGALVNSVSEESPAEKAGIREEDVIVEFNGKTIEESDDLTAAVRAASPGDRKSVTLYRGEQKKTVQVTLGKAPRRDFAFSFRGPGEITIPRIGPPSRLRMFRSGPTLGLTLSDLNPQLGEYFGAPEGRGVLVQEVDRKSAGDRAGFKAGDVILKAGKEDVETVEDIMDALRGLTKGDTLAFGILRKGAQMTLTAEPDGREDNRWNGFRSFELNGDAPLGIERNSLKREMENLKEELRSIGTRIRIEMQNFGKKLRSVTS